MKKILKQNSALPVPGMIQNQDFHNEEQKCYVNKNPTRCNSMQIFIYHKVILHVSGVTGVLKTVTAASGTGHTVKYKD